MFTYHVCTQIISDSLFELLFHKSARCGSGNGKFVRRENAKANFSALILTGSNLTRGESANEL